MAFKGEKFLWTDKKRILGMPISFTNYAISKDRLFLSRGVLSVRDEETLLYRVKDISLVRSLGQRILGVGTITVASGDPSCPVIQLKNIKDPMEVKELLHEQVEQAKARYRAQLGNAAALQAEGDDM